MTKGRLQRWLFLLTFAFNILALFAAMMALLSISERRLHPTGMYLFFCLCVGDLTHLEHHCAGTIPVGQMKQTHAQSGQHDDDPKFAIQLR